MVSFENFKGKKMGGPLVYPTSVQIRFSLNRLQKRTKHLQYLCRSVVNFLKDVLYATFDHTEKHHISHSK